METKMPRHLDSLSPPAPPHLLKIGSSRWIRKKEVLQRMEGSCGGAEAGDSHSLFQFSNSMILSVNDVAMCVKCFELRSNALYKFKGHYVHNHSC